MDNAQKAIMIGVGLFITIIVIAAVMLITGIGQDMLNSGTQQLSGISESLRIQITDQYHGKVMTATQVRTAVKDLVGRNDATIDTIVNDGTTDHDITGVNDTNIPANGTQKYTGSVNYDSTTGIATVTFTRN